MSTLARQGTSYRKPWSLERDAQLRTQLETTFGRLLGLGVVSGGLLSVVSGFTVRVPSGSVFEAEGVTLVLAANQDYTALEASATVYVWGQILRTAADQNTATALDTYSLDVSHNLTGAAPSELHFPLGVLANGAAGTLGIRDNAPAGKFIRAVSPLWAGKTALSSSQGSHVASDEQVQVFGGYQVRGALTVRGRFRVRGWN
jgi:hypothetical protein